MVEHAAIPNAGIHEPKGVSSASAGQVYLADGVGSGSWQLAYDITNEIRVEVEADFGVAVGGVITLAANTAYRVIGSVSIGSKLTLNSNNLIYGTSQLVSSLTYTGTDDFITAVDVAVRLKELTLNLPNQISSKFVINHTVTSGLTANLCSNIIVISCGSWCKSAGAPMALDVIQIISFSGKGYEFSGTAVPVVDLSKHLMIENDASAVHIDLGTMTTDSLLLKEMILVGLGTGISGLTASGNITTSNLGKVVDCTLSNVATPLSGVTVNDNQFEFRGNSGVGNSRVSGQGSIESNALTTTFGGLGVGNEVKVNFGTAFVPDFQNKVTVDNTGKFTYTGVNSRSFYFAAGVFGSVGGGAARDYVYVLKVNGTTIITSSKSQGEYTGATPGSLSVSSVLDLDEGDYVELFVRAETATTALTVSTCSMKLMGMGGN